MNEMCDRCGPAVAAVYRVERHGELYLCGHCTNRLRAALFAQGWTIWPAGERALAPQADECSGASWQRTWRGRGSGEPRITPPLGTRGRQASDEGVYERASRTAADTEQVSLRSRRWLSRLIQ